jgi:uncharacterized membrane protein
MAFCGNCGTQVQDGVKFCPSCGKEITDGAPQQASASPVVPGAPTQSDIKDAQDNKGMAIIAYIIFFIPLLTGDHRKSGFVKFHTNQGTVLFLAAIAYGIAYAILSALIFAILPLRIWWLFSTLLSLLWLVPAIFCILGIINAVNGRCKELPFIGGIKLIK